MESINSDSPVSTEQSSGAGDTVTTSALVPVDQRAALAVGSSKIETVIAGMISVAQSIAVITNKDGYEEAHAARIALKNTRIAIGKTSKEAREDATLFSKAVIVEEKRLIELITPEEDRLQKLQQEWDDAIEAEKQRRIEDERARQQAIKDSILRIQRLPIIAASKTPDEVKALQDECAAFTIEEGVFGEHAAYAAMVKADSITALTVMMTAAVNEQARQEQARKDQEELEKFRAKQRQDEADRAEQERIDRERQRLENEAAQQRLQDQERENAILREQLAALTSKQIAPANDDNVDIPLPAEATQKDVADTIDRPIPPPPVVAQIVPVAAIDVDESQKPSDEEIISVIAEFFDVTIDTARQWIACVQFSIPAAEAA